MRTTLDIDEMARTAQAMSFPIVRFG